MLIDLEQLERDTACDVDVCIVGAGPAGMTLAIDLANKDLTCALLESGGVETTAATRDLNFGVMHGEHNWPLTASRVRCLGGTSLRWRGWCRPLEPSDLELRPWIGHAGWPFGFSELAPWYRRAHEVCRAGSYCYDDLPGWAAEAGVPLVELPEVEQRLYMFSPVPDFGRDYAHGLAAPSIRAFVNATVVSLVPGPAGDRIERIEARSVGGRRLALRARQVVLAAGAIENARMLLVAQARGLVWGGDWVGRAFADHPHVLAGVLVPSRAQDLRAYDATTGTPSGWGRVVLALPELATRELRIPGATAILQPVEVGRGDIVWAILARSEQVPNRASRVALTADRDEFGTPRIAVDWRLSHVDRLAVVALVERLAAALPRAGLGRVVPRISANDSRWPSDLVGGCHHIGTTRMATDAAHGAVDRDGRVFGAENLHVAGSSVFCTAGVANPTLTIVALSLRLADHIARSLGRTRPPRNWYDDVGTPLPREDSYDETEAFLRRISVELKTRVGRIVSGLETSA